MNIKWKMKRFKLLNKITYRTFISKISSISSNLILIDFSDLPSIGIDIHAAKFVFLLRLKTFDFMNVT